MTLVLMGLTRTVGAQVQFPGPLSVNLTGEALSSVSLPLEVGEPAYMVNGDGQGVITLHRLLPSGSQFIRLEQFLVGGSLVHLIPWEGRPLLSQGVVAATANPDRVVFIRVLPQPPYFIIEDSVVLEEDPGTVSFVGNPIGGLFELAVSLPGVDKVAFLKQEEGSWRQVAVQDSGDQPYSILGVDIDRDQVRELVTAHRGPLSGTLGVFRRDQAGQYLGTQQAFPAGLPAELAGYDFDGDGWLEVAATVTGSPELVLLRGSAGQLVEYATIDLTLPADAIHLTTLYDGSPGLFASNRERGLVDFFQLFQGDWVRRNSYYPGCHPLGLASGDFNGDGGRDLVSMGGDDAVVTVLFANTQPGFWGFPALALNASPGASAIADFDGDGLRDLVVSNGNLPMLSFFRGQASGGFEISPTDFPLAFYPGQVAVLDSDADPGPELAVLDGSGGQVLVADYVAGEGFRIVSQTATGFSPSFLSAGDIDADGFQDLLVITGEVDEVRILFGAGDSSFPGMTALGLDNGADWVSVLDISSDGLPDLAMSDGVNRLWTTVNQGGRAFGLLSWLNAGSGAGIMAVGDLDQDLDDDLVVVNESEESLSLFENTGNGSLTRRIGAHTLTSAPTGIVIKDLDLNGRPELVMNLRDEEVLGVAFPLNNWEYSQTVVFSGGPDVSVFCVEDLNLDDVPDILTLDNTLKLGLTLLNVEQEMVAVHPEALVVSCGTTLLEIRIQPDRPGPWRLDHGVDGRWESLAESGQALVGDLDYERGTWILTVDRRDLRASAKAGVLRLTVGEADRIEALDISLASLCPEIPREVLPLVAWVRKPWPNPFNPLVNARFSLGRDTMVQAGVFDLAGRRVATLADGWFGAGDHALQWDGKNGGQAAGAGVYLMRISTPDMTILHKVMLIK